MNEPLFVWRGTCYRKWEEEYPDTNAYDEKKSTEWDVLWSQYNPFLLSLA